MKAEAVRTDIDLSAFIRHAIRKGILAGGDVYKEEVRLQLEDNQSRVTGTRFLWSDETQQDEDGSQDLIDSIRVVIVTADDVPIQTVLVAISKESSDKARFLEYGHEQVLWGRETGERSEPDPFMRPAYEIAKQRAVRAVVAETIKAMKA